MTIGTLVLNIGIVAAVITLIIGFLFKQHKSWLMTFFQNFCGVLFVFSGWVKAIDPLGTAYKMEQYFDEFYSTFSETWFSFIAPIFPVFSKYAIYFSLFMIIFEIVLGIMLLLGSKSKFTSWAFLLLVAFFTVLTGFTFLTGYVPGDANFFEFGSWAAYDMNNMKVTDCGCFGDFIKLEPKISFFKDLFLLIPAIYFVFRHKDMHQLFTEKIRNIITWVSIGVLISYCLNNYVYNLPHTDFRPFKVGTDVRAQLEAEEDAMASVQITDWILKERASGKIVELPNDVYMKQFQEYPKETWEIIDQKKTSPNIKPTKISEMAFVDIEEEYDVTGDILESEDASFMIVSHKLKMKVSTLNRTVQDTTWLIDTIQIADETETRVVKSIDNISTRKESTYEYTWDAAFIDKYRKKIVPLLNAANSDKIPFRIMIGGADKNAILAFKTALGLEGAQICSADDILLKTIVRSNPGVLIWKDGQILNKWHINKLPDYQKIKSAYLN